MTTSNIKNTNTLYLIYDEQCPLCSSSAQALSLKKAVGNVVLINARESHPLIDASYERGFDPDKGIVVIYNNQYYFGADAMHFLALLNSGSGTLNKIIAKLFRMRSFAIIIYPFLKLIRRILLWMKGVNAIEPNAGLPIFARVLGSDWQKLPPVMHKRFCNRPYTNDRVTVTGVMMIKSARWMRIIKPFLKLSGALIQQDGVNIPVKVQFRSERKSPKYWFDREFSFNHPERFQSFMINTKENIMVDFMRFNMGWRSRITAREDRVIFSHYGYVFRIFKFFIPLPIGLILGDCNVVERPLTEDTFSMKMSLSHFLFGIIYEYKGIFKIVEVTQEDLKKIK